MCLSILLLSQEQRLPGLILDLSDYWIQQPTSDLVTPDTFSAPTRIIYERLKRRQLCYFLLKGGLLSIKNCSILPSTLSSSLPLVLHVQDHGKSIRDAGAFSTFSSRGISCQAFTPFYFSSLALKQRTLSMDTICTQKIWELPWISETKWCLGRS